MPFEVTPSKSVDIDWSTAGHDDALRIVTTEPLTLFCALKHDSYTRLALIPGAIPEPIEQAATLAAREYIADASEHHDKEFEEWLNGQPDAHLGLRAVITTRLLEKAVVTAKRPSGVVRLDIGTELSVSFGSHPDIVTSSRVNGRLRRNASWTAPGTVKHLTPSSRFAAIKWAATNY